MSLLVNIKCNVVMEQKCLGWSWQIYAGQALILLSKDCDCLTPMMPRFFLGILVSVISFVYMQHSSECCDIQVSSEIQSTAWSHFSTLSSLWDLRDSSQSKRIGPRSLPAIIFPIPPLFRGYVIPLHGNLHGNWSGLSGVNVFYKSLMPAFHLFNNFALG